MFRVSKTIVRHGFYQDSVILMAASEKIQRITGVSQVVVFMATEMNKILCTELGLMTDEASLATPNDMIIGIEATDQELIDRILDRLDDYLSPRQEGKDEVQWEPSLEQAIKSNPMANLAVISLPGEFAGFASQKALDQGLNLFIFSQDVPIDEEVRLKQTAREKGLLVMGPGCGTAVIRGVSLGLMSRLSPGAVGIVGASGSGIQEIGVLLDRMGIGVSQAIGTGGRDLSDEVGGITMFQGIEALAEDDDIRVIVLVSKPPSRTTMEKVLTLAAGVGKPVVVNFLAGDENLIKAKGCIPARTLEDAAMSAARIIQGDRCTLPSEKDIRAELKNKADMEKAKFSSSQKYFRGLFCGGTHCEEAIMILAGYYDGIYSNVPMKPCVPLQSSFKSQLNSLVDMGAEEFTTGRVHPVIDPIPLKVRLSQEGLDPEVAVILLDIMLGYGAHTDPAGFLAHTIHKAIEDAARNGRHLLVVGSVCGTEKDAQVLSRQEKTLQDAGMLLFPSNARACNFIGLLGLPSSC